MLIGANYNKQIVELANLLHVHASKNVKITNVHQKAYILQNLSSTSVIILESADQMTKVADRKHAQYTSWYHLFIERTKTVTKI